MKQTRINGIIIALLLLLPISIFAQANRSERAFSISRSSDTGMDLRFELPQWKLETVERDGKTVQRVSIEDAEYIFIDEEETLPVFTATVAIPYRGGVTLSQLSAGNPGRQSVDIDFAGTLSRERAAGRYGAALYPQERATLSEPKVIRDFRVVSINVYPFQYDQNSGELLINRSMDIRLSFDNSPSINEMEAPTRYSRSFERVYQGLILNYDAVMSTRDVVYQNPVMLVIYGNFTDAIYQAKVQEYITWKKQRGFKVYSASTLTTGNTNTAIKTYIQNAYNTWEDKPEYIVLIGDTSGSIVVPTFGSYIDYQYTWLAGGDGLGDAFIGRISVENTDQMLRYIAKVNLMEKNINLNTATWLNRMLLVGDTASSGISTIYTNEYVADVSSRVNPSYTYNKLYGSSPGTTNMTAGVNQGNVFFNYRGYINMSGWTSVDYNTLSNAYRQFHAVFITCATGNFAGSTATTEAVVRAGTEAQPQGAFTAIGMATSSTHTTLNNCINVGIFHGLYTLGMRNMSEAMLLGKLYLDTVYGVSNPTDAVSFAAYCNLIGDPTGIVYVGIPSTFTINAPASVPAGAHNVGITITNAAAAPVEGASVTLTNAAGTLHVLGYTDELGFALLNLPDGLTGDMTVTVSKDDHKAAQSTISINAAGGIIFEEHWADDGNSGNSAGNGDGIVNGGESIELWVTVRNTSAAALAVSGRVACSDPYITLPDDLVDFGSIPAGATAENLSPIYFEVAPNAPDNHLAVFNFAGTNLNLTVTVLLRNGNPEVVSYTFVGAPGNLIHTGDQFPFSINVRNNGVTDLNTLSATLISHDQYFIVEDANGSWGNINAGATGTNSVNTFNVRATGQCINGMVIPMELQFSSPQGFSATRSFTITIGHTTVNQPLGQDAYGYFIFDMGDTGYIQTPTYNWIGIAPAEGGSGTALTLTDPGVSGNEGDQVGAVSITTVNLPFPFTFYGRNYTQASISSNGFIAFGSTTNSDWRNWRLPGPGGPNPMIAVFWDDLQLNAGSYVYTYYNATQHYYVVEWYNVINGYDGVTPETFQAILYDPAYYPTLTGDGQIKMQYKVFNNIDTGSGAGRPHGNYASIGIKDHTGTIGLEYSFNNTYPTAAAPLTHQSALFVTTRPIPLNAPHLAVGQVIVNDTAGNGNGNLDYSETAGLSVRLVNQGTITATGVTATLSSGSPYVTVTQANAAYGTVVGGGSAVPGTTFSVQVASQVPNSHMVDFVVDITSNEGTWQQYFSLPVYSPTLGFGSFSVSDPTGNNNNVLDPGETVTITIPITNTGGAPSPAGSATLSCSTTGVTVINGNASFGAVAAGGSINLNFTVSASSSISVGTLATLVFNATAGSFTANKTDNLEIGAPMSITIGSGTSAQTYPLDRYYNYSVHESLYLAAEIGTSASIKSLSLYKASGTDVNPIEGVNIYMKNTTSTSMTSGAYSTTGYTLVYSGNFPNTAASGWMEVNLNPMFVYDNTQNLSILIVKNYQQWINGYPQWSYTSVSPSRARQNRDDNNMPTTLTATANLPNIRLRYFPINTDIFPPQNLTATASHQSIKLDWEPPTSGNPTGYKIFRNGSLLTTVTGLTFTNTGLTNGTSYSYYLKAVFTGGDSDATPTVSATPNAIAPTNLTAVAGYAKVDLSWTAATGRAAVETEDAEQRAISGYRVYRNGSAVTTITGTTYQDTGLTNGSTYTYHVTTVYASPAGESAASNSVQATPSATAPTNLTAIAGNNTVQLSWNAVTREAIETFSTTDRNVTGYKVYRNASPIATVTETTYTDNSVVNGTSYSYYVTTLYSNPTGESAASNTVNATPQQVIQVTLGTGTGYSQNNVLTPINNTYKSIHGQSVYTAAELNSQGVVGPVYITGLGFNIGTVPTEALPNFIIRMKHTTATNVQSWHTAENLQTVFTTALYTPVAGAYDMLTFNTPFLWNGTDNILVDTAFAMLNQWTQTGTLQITTMTSGYRRVASDTVNQTDIFTGGTTGSFRPNVRLNLQPVQVGPMIEVTPTSFAYGTLAVGATSNRSFNIENTGDQNLSGSITTPTGYSVAAAGRNDAAAFASAADAQRNTINFNIPAGQSANYTLTFAPSTGGSFNGNVVISSNAVDNPTVNIAVTGAANNPPAINLPASFQFNMGSTLPVNFAPFVSDADGTTPTLTYSGNSNILVQVNGLQVTFSAVAGWFGSENITFTASDGIHNASDIVTVNVLLSSLDAPTVSCVQNGVGMQLSWNAVPNAAEYHIYRSDNPYAGFTLLTTTTNLSYTDPQSHGKVFYMVKAVRNAPAK